MTPHEWDCLTPVDRFPLIGTDASPYWLGGLPVVPLPGQPAFVGPLWTDRPFQGEFSWPTITAQPGPLFTLVVAAGITDSRNAARRLIEGGGIRVDDERIKNPLFEPKLPAVIRKGTHGQPVRVISPPIE
jgi:hypothetical protein